MNFESFFQELLNFYKVKTVTELAEVLNVTRSTVSGWKNRQAVGQILEYLFNNNQKALNYLFSNNIINKSIIQGENGRAAGNDFNEINGQLLNKITVGLLEQGISKFGTEEEFQFQLMQFLRG